MNLSQTQEKFTDNSIEIKMTVKQLEKIYKFSKSQFEDIKKRFNQYARKDGTMDLEGFKRSMGLLGFGEAEFLSSRIFSLITTEKTFNLIDFIKFLSLIIHGSQLEKARLSFKFIDKQNKKHITYDDIASIACEVSFLWHYLTGEKTVRDSDYILYIAERMGISESHPQINFEDYLALFQNQFFNWFDFFNNTLKPSTLAPSSSSSSPHPNNSSSAQPSLRQLQQTLKVFSHELYDLIVQLSSKRDFLTFSAQQLEQPHNTSTNTVKTLKGPLYIDAHTTPCRGDTSEAGDEDGVKGFENLIQEVRRNNGEDEGGMAMVASRLEQLYELGMKVMGKGSAGGAMEGGNRQQQRESLAIAEDEQNHKIEHRRATIINKGKPSTRKSNYVYFGHQNWNLMINMMLGIRKSIKWHFSINESSKHHITSAFELTPQIIQDYSGRYTYQLIDKRDQQYGKDFCYTFIDYSPKIFHHIRQLSKITTEMYLKSIGPENMIGSLVLGKLCTLTEQVSAGKSGSFIYYTEDSRFLIKTISKQEYDTLKQNLQNYHQYLIENPESYLVRIYGLHKLKKANSSKKFYFVVMNNFFSTPFQIDMRYDLKGSTYNRKAKDEKWDRSIALKDLDLIQNHKQGHTFNINANEKLKILSQIKKDVHFFSLNNITDYSLLIGVHKLEFGQRQKLLAQQSDPTFRGIINKSRTEVFFFGVIDILTSYSTKKMFQSRFMNLVAKGASSLPPLQYEKRFIDFIYTYVFNN